MTEFSADDPQAILKLLARVMCTLSFVIVAAVLWVSGTDVKKLREAEPKERFVFCRQTTINLCLMSAVLGVVQMSDLDDYQVGVDNKVDLGKYIEWTCTCPLTQLQLMIFAGPACSSVGVLTPALWTFGTLLSGAIASLTSNVIGKTLFFLVGCGCFVLLVYKMNRVVHEVSDGMDNLLFPKTKTSRLFTLVVTSWSIFPILWVLSPEGYDLAKNIDAFDAEIVTTFINAFVKLIFVACFHKTRRDSFREQTSQRRFSRQCKEEPSVDIEQSFDEQCKEDKGTDPDQILGGMVNVRV